MSWAYFPLHPETPMEGRALKDLFKGRESQVAMFQQQIREVAEREGLPYGDRTMTYNSRLAQELGSWADSVDPNNALHDLLYRAYFVHNQDISDIEVLLALVRQAGMDDVEAGQVLHERQFKNQVDADYLRARNNGITGVPTFISNDLYVVGCQTYDVLLKFLNHLRKAPRPNKSDATVN